MGLGKSSDKKFQAMKNQKKGFSSYNLILYSITGLACSLFCAYPYWFSSLNNSSMKQFFFMHLPSIWSYFSNPKCLFIVANVIIVFLVGESTFLGSSANSSPACDFYDEYVKRSRRLRGAASTFPDKKEKKKPDQMKLIGEESANIIDEVSLVRGAASTFPDKKEEKKPDQMKLIDEDGVNRIVDVKQVIKEKEKKFEDDDDEEPGGLPAEELNKRAEEFIARVNRQRLLEARSFICCQA